MMRLISTDLLASHRSLNTRALLYPNISYIEERPTEIFPNIVVHIILSGIIFWHSVLYIVTMVSSPSARLFG